MVRKLVLALALVCGLSFVANSAKAQSASFKVLHEFAGSDGDGGFPTGDLIKVGQSLFGTTYSGGNPAGCLYYHGCGALYSLNLVTGAEQLLYSFSDFANGIFPNGGLNHIGDTLYGTVCTGGGVDTPVWPSLVYSLNARTGVEKNVYVFPGGSDACPSGRMTKVENTFFGTSVSGGSAGYGTIFALNAKTGAETVLYTFQGGADGASPDGRLLELSHIFYGTTVSGGGCASAPAHGCGTVFSFNPATRSKKVLYSFRGGADGASPEGKLIFVNGVLYGTTYSGGDGQSGQCDTICGTVFALNPATGAEQVLHRFGKMNDGGLPTSGLVALKHKLYGITGDGGGSTTVYGCAFGCGTIYSVDMKSGEEKVVYAFPGDRDGYFPVGELLKVDGTIYGTTRFGGGGGVCGDTTCGTVFSFTP